MQAPSYTFLMGEYVGLLKVLANSPKLSKESREFYGKRWKELHGLDLKDLPLYQAEQISNEPTVMTLIKKGLY